MRNRNPHKVMVIEQTEWAELWRKHGASGRMLHLYDYFGVPASAVDTFKVKQPKHPDKNVRVELWFDEGVDISAIGPSHRLDG